MRALIEAAIAPGPIQPLATVRDELVRRYVELAVARSDGDRDAAAKALEIGVRTLYRYLMQCRQRCRFWQRRAPRNTDLRRHAHCTKPRP